MVIVVQTPGVDGFDGSLDAAVSRRQVLALAGTAGLATVLGACSQPSEVANSATPESSLTSATQARTSAVTAAPPAPPSPTEPVVPSSTVAARIISRDGWSAQPARQGGVPHTPTRLTIHHTGVVLGDNRNAPARLRQHQQLHQNDRGWVDIAYHVGVDRNGNIYQLRDPWIKGDTATDYDTDGHFLVVCEGNFDEEAVTEEQLQGAAMAFAWAVSTFPIGSTEVEGHQDYAATACPGADLYTHVTSGELTRRVTELLAVGPFSLPMISGPEAAQLVAAIENGQ
ncbi:peptidoglycan recognition protein family protein [Mycobacterium sp. ZZG]